MLHESVHGLPWVGFCIYFFGGNKIYLFLRKKGLLKGFNVRCRDMEKHGLLDKGIFTGGKSIVLVNYMYIVALLSQDSTQLKLIMTKINIKETRW